MRWLAASASVALVACFLPLAGCTAGSSKDPPAFAATPTTGVLRGVVVDQAIRPLANATVEAKGPDGASRASSTALDGSFVFLGLAPGGWFVTATKLAYTTVQQSVEVQAGVDDPPAVNLQLTYVPAAAPYANAFQVDAFVQCIVPGANLCAILNLYPCVVMQAAGQPCSNATSDTSYILFYDPLVQLQRPPDWFQTELVWESTQSVTTALAILASAHEPADGAGRDVRQASVHGASPLLLSWDRKQAMDWDLGTKKGVSYEIFGCTQAGVEDTAGCGGFVLNQRVTFYLHAFYGFVPPDGWRFSVDGPPEPPA